jgi:hypothetical protein
MKKIQLTQNKETIVDDNLYEYLNQWKWHASFGNKYNDVYVVRTKYLGTFDGKKKYKKIRMHRLIMELIKGRELKKEEFIDHINHDTLDNQIENIRIVSNRTNQTNRVHQGSSKYPGVCWHKQHKKWEAYIVINKIKKHLGLFDDENEASTMYQNALNKFKSNRAWKGGNQD